MEGGEDGNTLYTLPRKIREDVIQEDIILAPFVPVLAHTRETLTLPRFLIARIEGKSTLARRFLIVHTTAGFIDPGFSGQITLELMNLSGENMTLEPGMLICQVSFDMLDAEPLRAYGEEGLASKYQGQVGPTPARSGPLLPAMKYDGGPVHPGDLPTTAV